MFKKINILLIILLFGSSIYAQFGFKAGYEYCWYRFPFYNMQIAAYNFNTLNPDVSNDLKVSRMPGGISLGFVMGPKGFFEMSWHNYHGTDKGQYTNGGVDTIAFFKHRLNYTSMAFCFPVAEEIGLSAGTSMDFGAFKVLKKKTCAAAIDTTEYVNFYSNNSGALGVSLFLNYSLKLTNGISFNVRPSYRWMWLSKSLSFNSFEYYTNLRNFSVEFFILFGGSAVDD